MMKQDDHPKISIVMPVYNGEKYLSQTLESILRQTFTSYEVICVNDSSTDNSLSILKEYETKDSRIRVFSTQSNLGIVPKVINYAIPYIQGDYYVYSSQDDLFSEDWLINMFNRAVHTDADAVIPDLVFFYETENWKNNAIIGMNGNRDIMLSNREAVLLASCGAIPGNALWKTALIKKIGYYDFAMNADEYSAIVFFFNCNKIAFSKGTFFYRQDNPEAITKKLSYKTFSTPHASFMLWQFLRDNNFQTEVQAMILMRAVSQVTGLKVRLIKYNLRLASSDYVLEGAEEQIQKWFLYFKTRTVRNVLIRQKRFKNFVKVFAVMGNYGMFSFLCHGFVFLQFVRGGFKF